MHMEEYKANGWICNSWLQEVAGGGLHVNKGIGDLSLASGFVYSKGDVGGGGGPMFRKACKNAGHNT